MSQLVAEHPVAQAIGLAALSLLLSMNAAAAG